MKSLLAVTFLLALTSCAGREEPAAPEPAPLAATPPAASTTLPPDWIDPEPPDAQAKAEAVVSAAFNKGKTTGLKMKILPIVFRTSEIQGMASQLSAREEKIEDRLARLGAKVTEAEITIQLSGSVLFDFDSAEIRADAERTLTDVSNVISAYAGRPVRVEGHTDSIASDAYNQKLSQSRAGSVADWLAAHGVEKSRIKTAGFGESRPVATNDTAAGRQQNRRVEIVIAR